MANAREILSRMKSVQDTRKFTNAMYLISSTKLKKSKKLLEETEPYFYTLQDLIRRILRHMPDVEHFYFNPRSEIKGADRTKGLIVITGDKGLAGAYNHNVLKMAQEWMEQGDNHRLYVVGELCSQIFVFHREASGYRYRQSLSTLPDGFSGPNICAAVKWSEDMQHLFVSNRGHDSIAVFAVCRDHLLHRTDICRTGGRMPRDFGVFGSHLVVANQESRSLTVLTFDPAAGTLRQTSLCEELSAKPVCILPF